MEELFLVDGKICKLKDFEENIAYTKYYPIRVQGSFDSKLTFGYINKDNPKLIMKRVINAWGMDRTIIYAKQGNYYQIQNDELCICCGTNIAETAITEYTERLFTKTTKRLMKFEGIYGEEIETLKSFLGPMALMELEGEAKS